MDKVWLWGSSGQGGDCTLSQMSPESPFLCPLSTAFPPPPPRPLHPPCQASSPPNPRKSPLKELLLAQKLIRTELCRGLENQHIFFFHPQSFNSPQKSMRDPLRTLTTSFCQEDHWFSWPSLRKGGKPIPSGEKLNTETLQTLKGWEPSALNTLALNKWGDISELLSSWTSRFLGLT